VPLSGNNVCNRLLRAIVLEKGRALCDYGCMKLEAFGLREAGAGQAAQDEVG
jgi:hypothetical protein